MQLIHCPHCRGSQFAYGEITPASLCTFCGQSLYAPTIIELEAVPEAPRQPAAPNTPRKPQTGAPQQRTPQPGAPHTGAAKQPASQPRQEAQRQKKQPAPPAPGKSPAAEAPITQLTNPLPAEDGRFADALDEASAKRISDTRLNVFVSLYWIPLGLLLAFWAPWLALAGPGWATAVNSLALAATGVLIAWNLLAAIRVAHRTGHVIAAIPVTVMQIALFMLFFYQVAAHSGASNYVWDRKPTAGDWISFGLAHAMRAGDVVDGVEAYGLHIQSIHNASHLTAIALIAYHFVVTVFVLTLTVEWIGRGKRFLMADPARVTAFRWIAAAACGVLLLTWAACALWLRPWRAADIGLWPLDNLLRVLDFADLFEIYKIRLHKVPFLPLESTLTLAARLLLSLALAAVIGRFTGALRLLWLGGFGLTRADLEELAQSRFENIRRLAQRRRRKLDSVAARWKLNHRRWVAWPSLAATAGALAVLCAAALAAPRVAAPIDRLTQAALGEDQAAAGRALAGLRRLGLHAADAAAPLIEASARLTPERRGEVIDTAGYFGKGAIDPLAPLLADPDPATRLAAVSALRRIGPAASIELARGARSSDPAVADASRRALHALGSAAVQELIDNITAENCLELIPFLEEADPYWTRRSSANPEFAKVAGAYALRPVLLDESSSASALLAALRELRGTGAAGAMNAQRAIELAAGHEDDQVSDAAFEALPEISPGWMGTFAAREAAVKLAQELPRQNDPGTRIAQLRRLVRLGQPSLEVTAPLLDTVAVARGPARVEAIKTLRALDPSGGQAAATAQASEPHLRTILQLAASSEPSEQRYADEVARRLDVQTLARFLAGRDGDPRRASVRLAGGSSEASIAARWLLRLDPEGKNAAYALEQAGPQVASALRSSFAHSNASIRDLARAATPHLSIPAGASGESALVHAFLSGTGGSREALRLLMTADPDGARVAARLLQAPAVGGKTVGNANRKQELAAYVAPYLTCGVSELEQYAMTLLLRLDDPPRVAPLAAARLAATSDAAARYTLLQQLSAIDPQGQLTGEAIAQLDGGKFIAGRLGDANESVRSYAAAALGRSKNLDDESFAVLVARLTASDAPEGDPALAAAVRLDPSAERTLRAASEKEKLAPVAMAALGDPDPARAEYGRALAAALYKAKLIRLESLTAALLGSAPQQRAGALRVLAALDPAAKETAAAIAKSGAAPGGASIAEAAREGKPPEKLFAAYLFGRLGPAGRDGADVLGEWMAEPDGEVASIAGKALQRAAPEKYAAALAAARKTYGEKLSQAAEELAPVALAKISTSRIRSPRISPRIGAAPKQPSDSAQQNARKLLDSAPGALRGGEWSVLDQLVEGKSPRLIVWRSSPWLSAITEDGKQLYSVGDGGTGLNTFDVATGRTLTTTISSLVTGAMSPDGKHCAAIEPGKNATSVLIIPPGASDPKLASLTFRRHRSELRYALFSDSGERLITEDSSGQLYVWTADRGVVLKSLKRTPPPEPAKPAFPSIIELGGIGGLGGLGTASASRVVGLDAAFAPGGKQFCWRVDDQTVEIHHSEGGELVQKIDYSAAGGGGFEGALAFSPDGSRLATRMSSGEIKLWNVSDGALAATLGDTVLGFAFSPDGQRIAASDGADLIVYSAEGARLMRLPILPATTGLMAEKTGVRGLRFTPDGAWLLIFADPGILAIEWKTAHKM